MAFSLAVLSGPTLACSVRGWQTDYSVGHACQHIVYVNKVG